MKNLALGFLTPLFLCIVGELYLSLSHKSKIDIAKENGALPALGPQYILVKPNLSHELLPLGGISSHKTYLCDEGLGKTFYQADRYGFPNPDQLWGQASIDIAFLGDSYFQGACIPNHQSFVDRLRNGYHILNLSSFGHGPLSMLAMVREYLTKKKPKYVVMSYVPNDLFIDLTLELNHQTLKKYFDPLFQQDLMHQQKIVDQQYLNLLKTLQSPKKPSQNFYLGDLWRTFHLKHFDHQPVSSGYEADYLHLSKLRYDLYQKILAQIQQHIKQWRGKLYLMIIPDAFSFHHHNKERVARHIKRLQRIAHREKIEVINIFDLLNDDSNPYGHYTPQAGHYGHFNRKGQDKVFRHLKKFFNNKK